MVAFFFVNLQNYVRSKVSNPFEITYRDAQQQAHSARRAAHEPNVRHWRSQLNVAHALAADNGFGDQLAVFIDGSFARAYALELGIMRIDILDRAKDSLAEQAVALWLLGAIVNRFRLSDFAVAPF